MSVFLEKQSLDIKASVTLLYRKSEQRNGLKHIFHKCGHCIGNETGYYLKDNVHLWKGFIIIGTLNDQFLHYIDFKLAR